jgi:hypothetical protein
MIAVSTAQLERLGIVARQKPFALMNGTSGRVVGPVDAVYDALKWVISVGRNANGGHVSVEIEHSPDGDTWYAYEPPLVYQTTNAGETAYIDMTRADDVPASTIALRAVIRGQFKLDWQHAGVEVVCRYV